MIEKIAMDRCANCGRTHRSWRAVARCLWPDAGAIHYSGRYALLLPCRAEDNRRLYGHPRDGLVVVLADRIEHLVEEAHYECGGVCRRWRSGHDIVELECAPCAQADRRRAA